VDTGLEIFFLWKKSLCHSLVYTLVLMPLLQHAGS